MDSRIAAQTPAIDDAAVRLKSWEVQLKSTEDRASKTFSTASQLQSQIASASSTERHNELVRQYNQLVSQYATERAELDRTRDSRDVAGADYNRLVVPYNADVQRRRALHDQAADLFRSAERQTDDFNKKVDQRDELARVLRRSVSQMKGAGARSPDQQLP